MAERGTGGRQDHTVAPEAQVLGVGWGEASTLGQLKLTAHTRFPSRPASHQDSVPSRMRGGMTGERGQGPRHREQPHLL